MICPPQLELSRFHERGRVGHAGGFTLLEMCLVLAVMTLLLGFSVYSFGGVSREDELRRPASEFQRMVLESVRRAGMYERPQTIVFDNGGFLLRYRQEANGQNENGDHQLWQRRVATPPGMALTLRRAGAATFKPAAGQRLTIPPGGVCEPLTARFVLDNSWLELTLDPLSGRVAEESMNIQEGN